MNALEMMAKTVLEKAMANLSPEVLATIGQVGQIAVSLKGQLDRIEARLIRIENRLQIEPEELPHDRTGTKPVSPAG